MTNPPTPEAARMRETRTETPMDDEWLVWSYEHNAWWGANNCGYVASLLLAGLYTEADAKGIEHGANRSRKRKSEQAISLMDALAEEAERGRTGRKVIDVVTTALAAMAPVPDTRGRE